MYRRTAFDKLIIWKNKPNRKPLILRGARQVGKTTLVNMFAKEFDYFININLDKPDDLELFNKNDNIDTIVSILFLKNSIPQNGHNSKILLFIDEIQNSPKTVALLRYFFEEKSHLYVIAAGSLLESIIDNHISFPVGRVEYMVIRPFSFIEYLMAKEKKTEIELINTIPFPEYAHSHLLDLFTEYTLIGGMPEVVKSYIENKDLVQVSEIFDNLITTYLEDVEKYSKNPKQTKIIRHTISNAIKLAGERIKFEGFANSSYKSKDVSESFRILEKTFFLTLIYPTTSTKAPAIENIRKAPKIEILDTGIINKFAEIQIPILSDNNIDKVFEGKIAEHITGQELLAMQTNILAKNIFWVKEKNQSNAEVDYILQINSLLIPVEVKRGKTGRLRSLMEFIDLAPHNFAVRVYSGNLSLEKAKTTRGKSFTLLNLPFYLLPKIKEYIKKMISGESNEDSVI
jgi:predicted AAA+ superfamily ATPase